MKESISEQIKAVDNEIKQNKAKYDLGRQTTKISSLSPGNKFLTGVDVLPEKDLQSKDLGIHH